MSRDIFVFAEFTFDSETGILMRKNRGSHLPGQTAVLLEVLLKNANNLVSREELRQVLWPAEEFLDYTQGINVAVNRLRHTLRDSPRNPRFLKTIPKRGYTFYAEVRVVPRTTTPTTTSPALSVDLSASPPAASLEIRAAEAGDRASTEVEAEPIAQISTSSSEFSPVHVLPPFAPATASRFHPSAGFPIDFLRRSLSASAV